jgi:hypothetical protein
MEQKSLQKFNISPKAVLGIQAISKTALSYYAKSTSFILHGLHNA